ncbi:hypothetical protein PGT21_023310 [Puccinia graminis f. sp. tritici]|uniref:Uncharacterized protein n=1 Tax=Puccinia graminis f. sp. tritici TaxID=56615 RepID=A0A5B0MNS5_PUCGR|nr:hypothetical protein PGT21_023310 [Puccinia graminis f. sp. tritici]
MHPSVTSPARPFGLGSGQSPQPPRAGRFHEAGVLCRPSQEGETSGDEEYRGMPTGLDKKMFSWLGFRTGCLWRLTQVEPKTLGNSQITVWRDPADICPHLPSSHLSRYTFS